MSSDDLDAFRAELLRQKIVFESELRRQREAFEQKLATMTQELCDREADCRNLQAVVSILGKKVDGLSDQIARRAAVAATPRRAATPSGRPLHGGADEDATAADATSSSTMARRTAYGRRPSPLISAMSPSVVSLHRAPSITALSRTSSPQIVRSHHQQRNGHHVGSNNGAAAVAPSPRLAPRSSRSARRRNSSHDSRTSSAHRLDGVKATDDW